MENRAINGTFEYTITITDSEVNVSGDQTIENELASVLIAHSVIRFAKENLLKLSKVNKGKVLNHIRDRLGKATSAETILSIMAKDMTRVVLDEIKKKDENQDQNISENPESGHPLHSDGNQIKRSIKEVPADEEEKK